MAGLIASGLGLAVGFLRHEPHVHPVAAWGWLHAIWAVPSPCSQCDYIEDVACDTRVTNMGRGHYPRLNLSVSLSLYLSLSLNCNLSLSLRHTLSPATPYPQPHPIPSHNPA